jgi:hypothetical protein
MIGKPHRNNSDFQLLHFFAGSCHTPDGAWMVMYDQKRDIEDKLKHEDIQRLRREAKIEAANEIINDEHSRKSEKLEAQADILEANAEVDTWTLNIEAAKNELATINKIMAKLEPLRKYKDLPMLEANEAAQEEEWLRELQYRAENFMITQGTIPHDHFARMREHPKFKTDLLPHIKKVKEQLQNGNEAKVLDNNSFNLKLLK